MSYFSKLYNSIRYPIGDNNNKGLRRAQIGAIYSIGAHFTLHNDPAIVVMPTGAGKTAVLMMTAYIERAKRVLILTPSRLVRSQIANDFRNLNVLKRIGVLSDDISGPKVKEIENKIVSEETWESLKEFDVIVAIPNSISPAIEDVIKAPEKFFDLILVDEAHHSPANTWSEILDSFQNSKKVLFTATPFRQDKKEIKGKFVYTYPLSEAYKDNVYGNIKYVPVSQKGYISNDVAIAIETEKVFNIDKQAGFQHYVMVRTESIKRGKELLNIYQNNTKLNLRLINSKYSNNYIQKTIEKLRLGKLDGIICVDMLGEGFDFPNLKIAAIHVPHRSLSVTLQFIGRFARTNASNIGEAKFLAVPSEVRIETEKLFDESAVWQKIVTNLSESKIDEEIKIKEQIEKFEEPIVVDDEAGDLSLYSLIPYNHVKIFKTVDFNIDAEVKLPSPLELVYVQKSKKLNSIVFITKEVQKPLWINVNKFQKVIYDLFVIYYDSRAKLLFICASRKTEKLYAAISENFTKTIPTSLPLCTLNKVLINLKNPEFFNVGMRNRVSSSNTESYRIISGSNAHKAIKDSDGRLYHRGHLFGRGIDKEGKSCTIGFSSSSKVWSNSSSQIPEIIKWCKEIAEKTTSNKEVTTNSALDLLSTGEVATEIPEGVIAASWEKGAFITPLVAKYKLSDGIEHEVQLLDMDISIDVENSSKEKIIINLKTIDLEYLLEFSLSGDTFFKLIESNVDIKLQRYYKFHETNLSLIDYLNARPLTFYFADGSMLDGNNLFKNNVNPISYFNKSQIEVFDWKENNVDITKEFGQLNNNSISIQDALMEHLKQDSYDFIFLDHGTGESADFIAIKDSQYFIKIEFYHCKGSGDLNPGNRIGDIYEVCGQSVKSVQWTNRNELLLNRILRRQHLSFSHSFLKSRFIIGNEKTLKGLFNKTKKKRSVYEIVIVQPGITKEGIETKMIEVLAATNDYIIGADCEKLRVIASK